MKALLTPGCATSCAAHFERAPLLPQRQSHVLLLGLLVLPVPRLPFLSSTHSGLYIVLQVVRDHVPQRRLACFRPGSYPRGNRNLSDHR